MILVDAGPLLAALDRSDELHELCVASLAKLEGPMHTTWPAFTEAMHLIGARVGWMGQELLLGLMIRGELLLHSTVDASFRRLHDLMRKYKDVPMDLADASLVCLAEHLRTNRIFTFDQHFRVYRLNGRKSFTVIP